MKRYFLFFIFGGLGGLLGAALFGFAGDALPENGTANISATGTEQPVATPSPAISSMPDIWQGYVQNADLTSVAVQLFKDAKLQRSGSGTVVSSDGLILTTLETVSGISSALQVAYEDKILRGTVVARDSAKNLALIRAEISNLNSVNFNARPDIRSGKELVLTGKLMDLSRPVQFAQRGIIQYASFRAVVIDSAFKPFLDGAQVIASDGSVVGIVSLRAGKVGLITPGSITEFLDQYFESVKDTQ